MRGMALAYGYQPRVHWAPRSVPLLPPSRVAGRQTRERERERARVSRRWGRKTQEVEERTGRRGSLVLVRVVLVSHYRGGHKGSRRILILVSPNLLTYLAYPRSSRRIHPAPWDNSIPESSSLQRDKLRSPCLPLFLSAFLLSFLFSLPLACAASLFSLAASSPFLVVPR